jgi:hypothetical protein
MFMEVTVAARYRQSGRARRAEIFDTGYGQAIVAELRRAGLTGTGREQQASSRHNSGRERKKGLGNQPKSFL